MEYLKLDFWIDLLALVSLVLGIFGEHTLSYIFIVRFLSLVHYIHQIDDVFKLSLRFSTFMLFTK